MLNDRQRDILSGKLMDLGNIAIGSLIFGYILHSDAFNKLSLLIGLAIAVIAYWRAITLEK